jgi:hypothetical protein
VTSRDPDDAVLELMHAYLDAEYRFAHGGEWPLLAIGYPAPDLEAAFPDASAFGLLSAWNPHSVERPEQTNRAADAALHIALRDSGARFLPGISSARNRSWREPSWVTIDLPLEQLDALSRRFGQLGTLYCRRGEAFRLRMYADRPARVADDLPVDWMTAAG